LPGRCASGTGGPATVCLLLGRRHIESLAGREVTEGAGPVIGRGRPLSGRDELTHRDETAYQTTLSLGKPARRCAGGLGPKTEEESRSGFDTPKSGPPRTTPVFSRRI
jgi:hypothetical protein